MAVYKVLSLMISFAMLTLGMVEERNRRSKKTSAHRNKERPERKRA
ncbi:hypothetical protein M1K46_06455 [Fictibacillus sp. WQ 8-8]|nr:hypothetical protein [Fictibacillus sp. WQ 8-8]MCQ6265300.1 hypothetical protein [Fictibacillus sp. WQ 8-8]